MPTTRYAIKRNGEIIELDLCADHSAPIEELIAAKSDGKQPAKRVAPAAKKAPSSAAKKAPANRRRAAKVVSLDEIEAMKKQ